MSFDPPLSVGSLNIDSSEAAERMLLEHPEMSTRPHWAYAKKVLEQVAVRGGGQRAAYLAVWIAADVDRHNGGA
jgi:hypothetical protein